MLALVKKEQRLVNAKASWPNNTLMVQFSPIFMLVANLEELISMAIGGRIDGETPGLLAFTLPVAAGFPAIEEIFKDTKTRYPGSGLDVR